MFPLLLLLLLFFFFCIFQLVTAAFLLLTSSNHNTSHFFALSWIRFARTIHHKSVPHNSPCSSPIMVIPEQLMLFTHQYCFFLLHRIHFSCAEEVNFVWRDQSTTSTYCEAKLDNSGLLPSLHTVLISEKIFQSYTIFIIYLCQ